MSTRPNIVIIMTDQQRADLSRREGYPLDTTPFLDSLARQGTWFDRAYTSMPACVPARVSMLTGRYPSASRVRTNMGNTRDIVYTSDLFDVARERGYATALCGKNHSHLKPERVDYWNTTQHLGTEMNDAAVQEKAFDEYLHTLHFHVGEKPTPFPLSCQLPYRSVSKAQDWVRSVKGSPFLLWLSFPEPHNPYQVPEPYYSLVPPESLPQMTTGARDALRKGWPFRWLHDTFRIAFPDLDRQLPRIRSNYHGMLRMVDDQVKRFVEFLDSESLRDNTILVFLSDHGDFVGEYGLVRKGPELPESLVRIPLLFNGPGIRQSAAAHPAHVSIVDLLPTLCEAMGAEAPLGNQGRSLWPLLTGAEYPEDEFCSACVEHGFGGLHYTDSEPLDPRDDGLKPGEAFDCLNSRTQSGTMRAIRKGDWKLCMDMQGAGQLYNLPDDPAEMHNLFGKAEHAAKQLELTTDLLAWTLRAQDPLPEPHFRYVVKRDPRNYWSPYRG